MSRRKHVKQMTPLEITTIRDAIDSLNINVNSISNFGDHSVDRLVEKGLRAVDMMNCLRYGEVIEAHSKVRNDIRILLRLATKRGPSICVVVSLSKGSIVTAYENNTKDRHFTINWSEYQWKADLTKEIKIFMRKIGELKALELNS
jgi:hypothetical protein